MWRANSLEKTLMLGKIEGKRRKGQERMRWLDSITNSMEMNLSKLWEIVEDRGALRAIVHAVAKTQMWLSDWITTTTTLQESAWIPLPPGSLPHFQDGWVSLSLFLYTLPISLAHSMYSVILFSFTTFSNLYSLAVVYTFSLSHLESHLEQGWMRPDMPALWPLSLI